MKSKIKNLINLKSIVISVIAIVAIATLAALNIKGVTKNYTNNTLNYQFSYNSTWHISTDLSRKFDEQSFLLGLYIKAGCNVSDFINDESSGLKNFQACVKKSPKFKESESTYSEFKKNWNIENTQYLILTKLSKEEESKLAISVFPALINQQWPQGSFVMIRPLEYKLDFPQEDPNNSSGLSRTFVNMKDLKGYATDIRGTKIASKDLSVSVPYATEKSVYSGAKIQSMIFSTTASKDSRDEKVFYGILKSFSLL
jgi:hypothetical protein